MLGKQASKSGQLKFEVKVVWILSSQIITLFVLPNHYIDPTDLIFTKAIIEKENFLNNPS